VTDALTADHSKGTPAHSHIRRVQVERLFGLYDYDIASTATGSDPALLILYGDNGSGKTTLLRTIFHLLSSERGRGHKTFVANLPFHRMEVVLESGFRVTAERPGNEVRGTFEQCVFQGTKLVHKHLFTVVDAKIAPGSPKEERNYLSLITSLATLNLQFHYLGDDRKISISGGPETDSDTDTRTSYRILQARSQFEHGLISEAVVEDSDARLNDAIERAHRWIIRHTQSASDSGAVQANTIYAEVVRRIANYGKASTVSSTELMERKLAELAERNSTYARFGLSPGFDAGEFSGAMHHASAENQLLINSLLEPYIAGIEARLNALRDVQAIVSRFIENLRGFYETKNVIFDLKDGFLFRSANGDRLEVSMLSSGEKQLLLLLCNALASRDAANIFIIDEPEISLNVKWQRMFVKALLDCMEGSDSQLLLATHSIELLAQYRRFAVKLEHKNDRKAHS
jgi:energy-coupling factor transporter ATP-binding protein EcfA2